MKGTETKGMIRQWDQCSLLMPHHHLKFESIQIKHQNYLMLHPTLDWQTEIEHYKVEMEIEAREASNQMIAESPNLTVSQGE